MCFALAFDAWHRSRDGWFAFSHRFADAFTPLAVSGIGNDAPGARANVESVFRINRSERRMKNTLDFLSPNVTTSSPAAFWRRASVVRLLAPVAVCASMLGSVHAVEPPKYLAVPKFDKCLATTTTGTARSWCMPRSKRLRCPAASWSQLKALDKSDALPACPAKKTAQPVPKPVSGGAAD